MEGHFTNLGPKVQSNGMVNKKVKNFRSGATENNDFFGKIF